MARSETENMTVSKIAARLSSYRMTDAERQVWQELTEELRTKFTGMDFPETDLDALEERLCETVPYCIRRGYSTEYGFFEVYEEKGDISVIMRAETRREALTLLTCRLAKDISFEYVRKRQKELEKQNRGLWIDLSDKNQSGNSRPKYNTEYDYRKLWFELALRIVKQFLTEDELLREADNYEGLLNFRFSKPFWKFCLGSMEFVPID